MYTKTTFIILSILIFSSIFGGSVSASKIENLLDLPYGIEAYELELSEMNQMSFKNPAVQQTYDEFQKLHIEIKELLIVKYHAGEIEYYQMKDLVRAYNNFIFYTEKAFFYITFEDKWFRSKITQEAIYDAYSNMRISYIQMKHILVR